MKKYRKNVYDFNGRPGEALAWLEGIKQSDSWGSTRSCGGCLVAVLGFGGCTLQTMSGGHGGGFTVLTMLALVGGFAAFNYYSDFDTEDRRYQVPGEILQVLRDQLDEAREVTLRIDFRDTAQKAFQLQQSSQGDTRVSTFLQPWLEMQLRSRFGTQVVVKIRREQSEVTTTEGKETKVVKRCHDVAEMSCENPSAASRSLAYVEFEVDSSVRKQVAGTNGGSVAMRIEGHQDNVPPTAQFRGEILGRMLVEALGITG